MDPPPPPALSTAEGDLLEYYRQKMLAFEGERAVWLQRLADAEKQDAELHRLQWEAKTRGDDILQLREAVRDAELHIIDEHKQLIQLKAENEELKLKEVADRKTIQELLTISAAPTNTSADFAVFTAATPWPTAASVAQRAAADVSADSSSRGAGASTTRPGPSEPATVAALRKQVDQWTEWAREAETGLQQFRRDVQLGYERQHQLDQEKVAALQAEKSDLQIRYRALTRDYLMLRHAYHTTERGNAEQVAQARADAAAADARRASIEDKAITEKRILQASATANSRTLRAMLETSKLQAEADATVQTVSAEAEAAALALKVATLSDRLESALKRADDAEKRRRFEGQGFATDIATMRRTLAALELQWASVGSTVVHSTLAAEVELQRRAAEDVARALDRRAEFRLAEARSVAAGISSGDSGGEGVFASGRAPSASRRQNRAGTSSASAAPASAQPPAAGAAPSQPAADKGGAPPQLAYHRGGRLSAPAASAAAARGSAHRGEWGVRRIDAAEIGVPGGRQAAAANVSPPAAAAQSQQPAAARVAAPTQTRGIDAAVQQGDPPRSRSRRSTSRGATGPRDFPVLYRNPRSSGYGSSGSGGRPRGRSLVNAAEINARAVQPPLGPTALDGASYSGLEDWLRLLHELEHRQLQQPDAQRSSTSGSRRAGVSGSSNGGEMLRPPWES